MVIGGLITADKSSKTVVAQAETNMLSTAADLATLVNTKLNMEITLAAALASDLQLQTAAGAILTDGLAHHQPDIAALRQTLQNKFEALGGDYLGLFVTTADGQLYTGHLANGQEYKGSNIGDREYFKQVQTTKKPAISDIVRSKSTGQMIVVVVAPIVGKDDRFLGVLGLSMNAKHLANLVSAKTVGQTGHAFMVNSKGIVIAHPKEEFLLQLDLKGVEGMEAISGNMTAGKVGVDEYAFEGQGRVAGYAPVPLTQWSVGVSQAKEEFTHVSRALRLTIAVTAVLSLGAALLASVASSRSIVRPINRVMADLQVIAKGDLTRRVDETGGGEVGELARGINTMTSGFIRMFREMVNCTHTITLSSTRIERNSEHLNAGAYPTPFPTSRKSPRPLPQGKSRKGPS